MKGFDDWNNPQSRLWKAQVQWVWVFYASIVVTNILSGKWPGQVVLTCWVVHGFSHAGKAVCMCVLGHCCTYAVSVSVLLKNLYFQVPSDSCTQSGSGSNRSLQSDRLVRAWTGGPRAIPGWPQRKSTLNASVWQSHAALYVLILIIADIKMRCLFWWDSHSLLYGGIPKIIQVRTLLGKSMLVSKMADSCRSHSCGRICCKQEHSQALKPVCFIGVDYTLPVARVLRPILYLAW